MNLKITALTLCLLTTTHANAGWFDSLKEKATEIKDEVKQEYSDTTVSALSDEDITAGLKEALVKAADYSVDKLGRAGGFADNTKVRIPMPEKLSKLEKLLRKTGQDKYADEFVETMNHAAETSAGATLEILKTGVKNLTISDAKNILNGPDDAATQYLRKTGGAELTRQISPIVKDATGKTGVTRLYKKLYDNLGFMGKYMKPEDYDIDAYVTNKTLDGIFVMIAEQEKMIRDNPLERTSDILKSVFGSTD
ncbi:MAG: DUF4197 domain-containing protein [Gammaproteobacteria bacterium]|nr:DUF4197 domain-containing protein [Gammaproteobacteria bacterium]